MGFYNIGYTKS